MAPRVPTTIVFVPGAWHNPHCYDIVAHQLRQSGYSTSLVNLASIGPATHLTDWSEDVARIRTRIEAAADKGDEVLVCVHSYGGFPGNEAIKGLSLVARREKGLEGGVSHIFFCCSFVAPEGKSLDDATGGSDPPWYVVSKDGMEVFPSDPGDLFYNDMSVDEREAAIAMLKPFSYRCFHSKLTYAAWKEVPSTYLYCLQDAALPLAFQKMMVEEWAKGYNFRTEELDASHSPFFSHPEEMAKAIRRAAGEGVQ